MAFVIIVIILILAIAAVHIISAYTCAPQRVPIARQRLHVLAMPLKPATGELDAQDAAVLTALRVLAKADQKLTLRAVIDSNDLDRLDHVRLDDGRTLLVLAQR